MFETLITGGTIVNAEGPRECDVAIDRGKIAGLLRPRESALARTLIDAKGLVLLPGLVDAHAHLREPGLTHKEDFDSGTHAAALGGVTTVLDMPTDDPWTATRDQLHQKMDLAAGKIHVDVGFQAAVSQALEQIDRIATLAPVSFELFTADVPQSFLFPDLASVTRALERFVGLETLVGISPGDQSILAASMAQDKGSDVRAFLASRPPLAEANGIARAILAAAQAKARIHIRQTNSRLGIETWRRMRDFADASIETTPQNLFFTADDYEAGGSSLKASPPFRTREDVEALRAAVGTGLVSMIATDHAPHSPGEKAAVYPAFADVPGGMPGLQTLLQMMLKLVDEGLIEFPDLARLCAKNPADRFGLGSSKGAIAPGRDADIIFIDPEATDVIATIQQVSRAGYTPFDGWPVRGRLRRVYLRGTEIVRDGKLVKKSLGKVVARHG